jgi:hypothetical protein
MDKLSLHVLTACTGAAAAAGAGAGAASSGGAGAGAAARKAAPGSGARKRSCRGRAAGRPARVAAAEACDRLAVELVEASSCHRADERGHLRIEASAGGRGCLPEVASEQLRDVGRGRGRLLLTERSE